MAHGVPIIVAVVPKDIASDCLENDKWLDGCNSGWYTIWRELWIVIGKAGRRTPRYLRPHRLDQGVRGLAPEIRSNRGTAGASSIG